MCVCMPVFQSSVGKMYEAGQLNLLSVLELMNHALQLFKEERFRAADHKPLPQLNPHHLQEKSLQMAQALEDLRLMRYTVPLVPSQQIE